MGGDPPLRHALYEIPEPWLRVHIPRDKEAIEPTYSKWGRLPRTRRAGVLGGVGDVSRLGVVSS